MSDILIPHNGWRARPHQMALYKYLRGGGKRAVAIWHRRAGKDEVCLHYSAIAALTRPANYWHVLPLYTQGRRAIWTAVNPHTGKRRIDEAFPLELRTNTNDQTMQIRLVNGSTWSVVGSDSDNLVGASTAGIIFSEYALSNPSMWAFFKPILEENNGWAVFISTPRGHNHCKAMYDHAASTQDWFSQVLTARDTGALSDAALAEAKAELIALYGTDMGRAAFDQEYMCSWNAAVLGSIFALEMAAVRAEGRVLPIEAIAGRPVDRAWDLGTRHSTVIWMFQSAGAQVRVLDCLPASGAGIEYYRNELERIYAERGWTHGTDYVPHDAKVLEFGSGRTRVEMMKSLGLAPMLVRDASVEDGINAVRHTLPLCVFDPRCERGLAALEQYQREWDDDMKCFRVKPRQDWATDFADSFRYLSMAWQPAPLRTVRVPPRQGISIPPPPEPQRGRIQL